MSNPELITTENNNDEEKEPESSSRMISSRELAESQKNAEDKKQKKNEKNEEENKFIIEEEYLKLDECTAITLGPEKIFQKCFVCPFCNRKKIIIYANFVIINVIKNVEMLQKLIQSKKISKEKKNSHAFAVIN